MKRMVTFSLAAVLLLVMAGGTSARKAVRVQDRDVSAQVKEKMDLLAWLEGTWMGETMMSRSGKKLSDTVTLTETVHFEMDGMIMVLESVGKQDDKIVQQTWTTITYDARHDKYMMLTMTEDGGLIQPKINANEQGLQWQMKMKNMVAKYTIEKDGNGRKDTSYIAKSNAENLDWQPVFSLEMQKQ